MIASGLVVSSTPRNPIRVRVKIRIRVRISRVLHTTEPWHRLLGRVAPKDTPAEGGTGLLLLPVFDEHDAPDDDVERVEDCHPNSYK